MKMRKTITLLLLAAFIMCGHTYAQNRGKDLMKQAETSLAQKEYVKARYLFLQAYSAFAQQGDYADAVKCGVQTSALYHRENYYKEAFNVLRGAEQVILSDTKQSSSSMATLRFPITKERLRMYIKLKNLARAQDQLGQLEELAKTAGNDSLSNDLLYTQATYYYTFGMNQQGDQAFGKLVAQYNSQKKYDQVKECYQTLIGIGRSTNNSALVSRTYENYLNWSDSVQALIARDDYNALKAKYDESQATIQDKDSSLASRQYIIIALCVLAAILAAALVLGAIVLLRFIALTRKQKKAIETANQHNELKTQFIQNISAQMEPTLAKLDAANPSVQALHTFTAHIQELSDLESNQSQPYDMEERNACTFCEDLIEQIKPLAAEGVTLTVNAPKLSIKISPEPLEKLLLHLLRNAAAYTPAEGKIWLDYKKRGAHTQQFIVTDTGCGIPEDQRENLFKPFSAVRDLTQGDGLGLPICALMATRMNGSLSIDPAYTKGTRFVLELHT